MSLEDLQAQYTARRNTLAAAQDVAREHIAAGRYKEAHQVVSDTMSSLRDSPLQQLFASRNAAIASAVSSSKMSGGKIAAYVAGIGLLTAGAVTIYNHHQSKKRAWTERVDQQNSSPSMQR